MTKVKPGHWAGTTIEELKAQVRAQERTIELLTDAARLQRERAERLQAVLDARIMASMAPNGTEAAAAK